MFPYSNIKHSGELWKSSELGRPGYKYSLQPFTVSVNLGEPVNISFPNYKMRKTSLMPG